MKRACCCVLLLLLMHMGYGQQYLLFLKDKNGSQYSLSNPQAYLSARALARRQRYTLPIDSTDLPVAASYLAQLNSIPGLQVLNASRWLNAVSVRVSNTGALQQAQSLPFIRGVQLTGNAAAPGKQVWKPLLGEAAATAPPLSVTGTQQDYYQYGAALQQVALHKGNFLHNIGLRGDSMTIGILDAGFFRYDQLPAFDSARAQGRILGTWDFVTNEASVAEDDAHGMQCFSVIGANLPGALVGSAPASRFYLFRSEDARSETLIEEFNWVCAAERLDSAGGDLISSSLGYSVFDGGRGNHTQSDLDGNTTLVTRGADLAAKKGILVVNAAGNEGNNNWRQIIAPADGDSVLAVGAVSANGTVASFSSYGPAADGQIKPDVAAMGAGTLLQGSNGNIVTGNGTSFACPVIAGLAACLWQGFPEAGSQQVIAAIRQAGHIAASPDNRLGYGIPDMRRAFATLLRQQVQTSVSAAGCAVKLQWQSKDMQAMYYVVERMGPDGQMQRIGTVQGTGTVTGNRQYSFNDPAASAGTFTYRIVQVLDTSAASFYALALDTLRITTSGPCTTPQRFVLSPNPGRGLTTLRCIAQEPIAVMHIVIINGSGQQVRRFSTTKPSGSFMLPLNTAFLAAGQYFMRIYGNGRLLASLPYQQL